MSNTLTKLSLSEIWNGMLEKYRSQLICAYYNRIIACGNSGINWSLWDKTPEWVHIPKRTTDVRQDLASQLLDWVDANRNLDFAKIQGEHFKAVLEHVYASFKAYYCAPDVSESPRVVQFVAFAITKMENSIAVVVAPVTGA